MSVSDVVAETSEAQLRAALDAMPHKVWLVRPEGPPLYYNRAMRAFGGDALNLPDRASRENKEFIQQLFPPGEIYATIFSQKIQDAIGEVGPESVSAKSMLTRIGFRYDERIDPFDGGPHFSAPSELIEPIRRFRRAKLSQHRLPHDLPGDVEDRLIAVERTQGRNRFRAVRAPCLFRDAEVQLSEEAVETLGAEDGDRLHTIPCE